MNEQQKAVNAFLMENNITYIARYVGETMRDNKWQCDAWRVSFAAGKSRCETDYFTGLGHRKKGREYVNAGFKTPDNPVAPCAADVLYSLVLDSSAIDTSFDYWCDEYGYDADSISAFNTYQQCCKIAKEMRQVFNHAQIEALRGMLEDY